MISLRHSVKTHKLKFGFMPDFNTSIAGEIDFARRYFSFIEITFRDSDLTKQRIKFLKNKLGNLKVFGHLHWEIDLTNHSMVLKHLKAYQKIGAKQITIHPQSNMDLKPYLDFCQKNHIKLLVENNIHKPFNTPQIFKEVFDQYPSLGMTFDWGHSQFKPQLTKEFFNLFAKKIQHIHLHYTHKQELDHLAFPAYEQSWQECFQSLKQHKIQPTITLEMFYKLIDNQRVPLANVSRKQIILKQLEKIKC